MITDDYRLEYDLTKDKFYLVNRDTNLIEETFYGDYALKEYLFDIYDDYNAIEEFVNIVYDI